MGYNRVYNIHPNILTMMHHFESLLVQNKDFIFNRASFAYTLDIISVAMFVLLRCKPINVTWSNEVYSLMPCRENLSVQNS